MVTIRHATRRLVWATVLIVFVLAASTGSARASGVTLTASPNPALLGQTITFKFSPKVMASDDTLNFDFGDGKQGTVAFTTYCALFGGCGTITHSYTRVGSFLVLASGKLGGVNVSGSLTVSIATGNDSYILAAAHVIGANQTVWRTDVEVLNVGTNTAAFGIALLPRGADNSAPVVKTFSVPVGKATRLADILSTEFHFTGSAALRVSPEVGSILVTSRTYNSGPDGTYGQSIPAMPLGEAVGTNAEAFLIQLSHDPTLKAGYRTNIGLVNPTPTQEDVLLTFYSNDGTTLGSTTFTLKPYGYEQLDRAFELVTSDQVPDGYVTITNAGDGMFFTYASVVDNLTGDPTLVPALVP